MSNRSYPADFSRPLREVPVATDEDVQRMLERLRRRCKVGKTSSQMAHEEARPRAELSLDFNDSSGEISGSILDKANHLPDGAKPSPPAVANIDAASSAEPTFSAGSSVVSGTAAITATAGGGSNGAKPTGSFPFQPTRPVGELGNGCEGRNTESPHPESVSQPFQWIRASYTAMRTTCGTWTCCKVTVMGKVTYELWRRIAGLERPVRVTEPFGSFEQAKQAAQDEMDRVD